jgi:formate dehydrogenase iron-sulfur subunit
MEVCPTGAIIRTEFDTVFIQPNVCNGCRDCIAACPYDVIGIDENRGVVQKCTLCYDRLQGGLEPACAKACPTESIVFGTVEELRATARRRVSDLHDQGITQARLYGEDDKVYGGLNAFFLLMDEPGKYKLPNAENAVLPRRNNLGGYLGVLGTAILAVVGGLVALRRRRQPAVATPKGPEPAVDAASAGPPAPAPEPRTETDTGDER